MSMDVNLSGKVLVTGGAGFIGSHLVDKLLSMETVEELRVLDNFFTGRLENLEKWANDPRFVLIQGDVRKREIVQKVTKNVDFVFHEAAIASVPLSIKEPLTTHEVNVAGTLNLLEEARANDSTFLYASSCAVYGTPKRIPIREEDVAKPLSPYGASKLAAEAYCLAYNETYGLKTVCLRYFNVYGPRQTYSPYAGVITIFINRALKGEPPVIYGDGRQTRDFIYVDDVVVASILAATCNKAHGRVLNVGTGVETSINSLASKIKRILGTENLKITYGPAQKGEIRRSAADISRMMELLGYKPRTSLDQGLLRTIRWFSGEVCEGLPNI